MESESTPNANSLNGLSVTQSTPTNEKTTRKNKNPGPNEGKCHFYMKTKSRYCRMGAMPQSKYCGEHLAMDIEKNATMKRIPCPLDPEHTCFEKDLKAHLKKCNEKPKKAEVYFCKGINADVSNNTVNGTTADVVPFADLSIAELRDLIDLVQSVHKEFIPPIAEKFGFHPAVAAEMVTTTIGDSAMKHLVQNASLLSLLENHNLLQSSTSFLEFGSGRGALTFWLCQTSVSNDTTSHFLLLDKKSHRHKRDNKLKDTGLEVIRIRIDIQDLKLDALPSVNATDHIVGITKHLCGRATDLALRCLLETNSKVSKVAGLVLATCCHHACTYESYAGKAQLEKWGLTKKHFRYLIALSSWAVCGTGSSSFSTPKKDDTVVEDCNETKKKDIATNPKYVSLNLDVDKRRQIGIQAKEILDYGRCMYIQSFGLNATLLHYTDQSATYENVAIVATKS